MRLDEPRDIDDLTEQQEEELFDLKFRGDPDAVEFIGMIDEIEVVPGEAE